MGGGRERPNGNALPCEVPDSIPGTAAVCLSSAFEGLTRAGPRRAGPSFGKVSIRQPSRPPGLWPLDYGTCASGCCRCCQCAAGVALASPGGACCRRDGQLAPQAPAQPSGLAGRQARRQAGQHLAGTAAREPIMRSPGGLASWPGVLAGRAQVRGSRPKARGLQGLARPAGSRGHRAALIITPAARAGLERRTRRIFQQQ